MNLSNFKAESNTLNYIIIFLDFQVQFRDLSHEDFSIGILLASHGPRIKYTILTSPTQLSLKLQVACDQIYCQLQLLYFGQGLIPMANQWNFLFLNQMQNLLNVHFRPLLNQVLKSSDYLNYECSWFKSTIHVNDNKNRKKNAHSIWLPMENQYNKLVPQQKLVRDIIYSIPRQQTNLQTE